MTPEGVGCRSASAVERLSAIRDRQDREPGRWASLRLTHPTGHFTRRDWTTIDTPVVETEAALGGAAGVAGGRLSDEPWASRLRPRLSADRLQSAGGLCTDPAAEPGDLSRGRGLAALARAVLRLVLAGGVGEESVSGGAVRGEALRSLTLPAPGRSRVGRRGTWRNATEGVPYSDRAGAMRDRESVSDRLLAPLPEERGSQREAGAFGMLTRLRRESMAPRRSVRLRAGAVGLLRSTHPDGLPCSRGRSFNVSTSEKPTPENVDAEDWRDRVRVALLYGSPLFAAAILVSLCVLQDYHLLPVSRGYRERNVLFWIHGALAVAGSIMGGTLSPGDVSRRVSLAAIAAPLSAVAYFVAVAVCTLLFVQINI